MLWRDRITGTILLTLLAGGALVSAQPGITLLPYQTQALWFQSKQAWTMRTLSKSEALNVSSSVDLERLKYRILPHLLVVRPPGSSGSSYVRGIITTILQNFLGWTVEHNTFTASPPYPHTRTTFTNIIATHYPSAKRRLVLACHYDSKIKPRNFLGATDSAVPCAIMIEIAVALESLLNRGKGKNELTLQLIFFDGEEAFVRWSNSDSLYGSRHLAAKWQGMPWPPNDSTTTKTKLDSIDLLVVLDLLGASNQRFYNSELVVSKNFDDLVRIEQSLFGRNSYFQTRKTRNYVEDDHLPFYLRKVDVLHVIPDPFPVQWHTLYDNFSNLDFTTISRLTNIFAVFVCEYLHLDIS